MFFLKYPLQKLKQNPDEKLQTVKTTQKIKITYYRLK